MKKSTFHSKHISYIDDDDDEDGFEKGGVSIVNFMKVEEEPLLLRKT
jgi:hypothetical protein